LDKTNICIFLVQQLHKFISIILLIVHLACLRGCSLPLIVALLRVLGITGDTINMEPDKVLRRPLSHTTNSIYFCIVAILFSCYFKI